MLERIRTAPARQEAAIKTIESAIRGRGVKLKSDRSASSDWFGWNYTVDDTNVRVASKITSGRIRFIVGGYSRVKMRKQFPEPNAGFNIEKIVDAILSWVSYERERKTRESSRKIKEKKAERELNRFFRENPKLLELRDFVEHDGEEFKVVLKFPLVDALKRVLLATLDPT